MLLYVGAGRVQTRLVQMNICLICVRQNWCGMILPVCGVMMMVSGDKSTSKTALELHKVMMKD